MNSNLQLIPNPNEDSKNASLQKLIQTAGSLSNNQLELLLNLAYEMSGGRTDTKNQLRVLNRAMDRATLSFLSKNIIDSLQRYEIFNLERLMQIVNLEIPVETLSHYKNFGAIKLKEIFEKLYVNGHISNEKYQRIKAEWSRFFRTTLEDEQ